MRFIAEREVISLMVTSKIRLVLITSCTVGPDFTVPDPPDVQVMHHGWFAGDPERALQCRSLAALLATCKTGAIASAELR